MSQAWASLESCKPPANIVFPPVRNKPRGLWRKMHLTVKKITRERIERLPHDTLLRLIEQQSIVRNAGSTANVVSRMSRKCSPGSLSEQETRSNPCIDSDAAEFQSRNRIIKSGSQLLNRSRMNQQSDAKRSPKLFIRERDRILEILHRRISRQ